VSVRIPADVLKQVQKWAKATKLSRSAAIAALVERGLRAEASE